jgi:hypothetical protein
MPASMSFSTDSRGEHFVRLRKDLTGFGIHDVVREHFAVDVLARHAQALHPQPLRVGARGAP